MDINEIKKQEIEDIIDFYYHVKDYGHIFHLDSKLLDEPFRKIMDGISEIKKMMEQSYDM